MGDIDILILSPNKNKLLKVTVLWDVTSCSLSRLIRQHVLRN
jgi:hypothetical protein